MDVVKNMINDAVLWGAGILSAIAVGGLIITKIKGTASTSEQKKQQATHDMWDNIGGWVIFLGALLAVIAIVTVISSTITSSVS